MTNVWDDKFCVRFVGYTLNLRPNDPHNWYSVHSIKCKKIKFKRPCKTSINVMAKSKGLIFTWPNTCTCYQVTITYAYNISYLGMFREINPCHILTHYDKLLFVRILYSPTEWARVLIEPDRLINEPFLIMSDWLPVLLCTMNVTFTSISPRYFSAFFEPTLFFSAYHLIRINKLSHNKHSTIQCSKYNEMHTSIYY